MKFEKENINICITRNQKFAYSETFIRNQIKKLSEMANVFSLHTGRLPEKEENGNSIYPWYKWILHKLQRGITQNRNTYFSNKVLAKYLINNKIDIVLSNFGMSAAHMSIICNKVNIPLVPHFHGFDATKQKVIENYGELYKQMFQRSPAIVAVSEVMKKKLIRLGAAEEKVVVIPYGINLTQFTAATNKATDQFIFLAVGRFTAKKAPLLTIKAFEKISHQVPHATLIMIGGKEELFEECEKYVTEHHLKNKITFTSTLPNDKIAEHMQQAHAFVQHSITASNGDMEGTPLSILEAAASGLPVISTLHGGIMEAVINNKTGLLCKEKDVDAMAENMLLLANNPAMARQFGIAGRLHMEKHYDLEKQSLKLFELLKDSAKHFKQNS